MRSKDGEESWSSWANLGNVGIWTRRGKRLAKHAGTDSISLTFNSVHSTDDFTRKNNRDEDQVKQAGTKIVIRRSVVERGLVNHT